MEPAEGTSHFHTEDTEDGKLSWQDPVDVLDERRIRNEHEDCGK